MSVTQTSRIAMDYAVDDNVIVSGSRELELMEVERVRSGKFSG